MDKIIAASLLDFPVVGVLGPCEIGQGEGAAAEIDIESREALCTCAKFHCALDNHNHIVESYHQGDPKSPYVVPAPNEATISAKDLRNA